MGYHSNDYQQKARDSFTELEEVRFHIVNEALLEGHETMKWGLLASLCMKCSLGISNFLDEISSLSHSVVFLYFFALIAEEGFLISPCYSLEL